MDTKAYFHSCRPPGHPERMLSIRVGNALSRAGITTMAQLCQMAPEELQRVRNLGPKGFAVAMEERRRCQEGYSSPPHRDKDTW